jgi:integrase/recombinase XerD
MIRSVATKGQLRPQGKACWPPKPATRKGNALQEDIREFLEYLEFERRLSLNTRLSYGRDLRDFARYCEAHPGLDRECIIAYLESLKHAGLSQATRARRLAAIRAFYNFLEREERIDANPTANLDSPAKTRRLPGVLSEAEVVRLIETPDVRTLIGVRDRAMLEVIYATGLRVSELCQLTINDWWSDPPRVRCLGKGSKERYVPMGRTAMRWLANTSTRCAPGWRGKEVPTGFFSIVGDSLSPAKDSGSC